MPSVHYVPDRETCMRCSFFMQTAAHRHVWEPQHPSGVLVALPLVVKWGRGRRNLGWSNKEELTTGPQSVVPDVSPQSGARAHVGTRKTCTFLSPAQTFRIKTLENTAVRFTKGAPPALTAAPESPSPSIAQEFARNKKPRAPPHTY